MEKEMDLGIFIPHPEGDDPHQQIVVLKYTYKGKTTHYMGGGIHPKLKEVDKETAIFWIREAKLARVHCTHRYHAPWVIPPEGAP